MQLALVGCGYAADYYLATFANHPSLNVVGVYDRDAERQRAFTTYHAVPGYRSFAELLADARVELVVNVTNPTSHVEVTEAALLAGKHVYVEKPIALDLSEARRLVSLAAQRGLQLGSAPCNLLGSSAQTTWRAIRDGLIGRPLVVYAELDAGQFQHATPEKWVSLSGAPWPYRDEFTTGTVIEHAAYKLSWMTAFFGPAIQVHAFGARVLPMRDLMPDGVATADDFSVACLTFANGVVARLTCSLTARLDQSLRIIGDAGTLTVAHSGDFASPVTITRGADDEPTLLPLLDDGVVLRCDQSLRGYDFARGVADLACAAAGTQPSHLPIDHSLHVLELTLAIARREEGATARLDTTFAPVQPPSWAK